MLNKALWKKVLHQGYIIFRKYKHNINSVSSPASKRVSSQLLNSFKSRRPPTFFIHAQDRSTKTQVLTQIYPGVKGGIIGDAENICDHVFDLLGSGKVQLGESIPWNTDFKSGYSWFPKFYLDMVPIDPLDDPVKRELKYDGKIPYELSRLQHLPTLGKAYWLTGNEKYAREFINEIEDWIESNPPLYGVNWTCTMDVAIRAVNWIWGYYFFKDSPKVTDEFLLKFLKSLYIHGKFIMQNLEGGPWRINSNHYLSDIVGLVYLGVMLPEFKEAKRWRELGVKALIKEMEKQVYPDGVDYEESISYHRLVTELFLSATALCLKNGAGFPDWYMERLEEMLEFVMYYTKPDGTAPQIGDNDDGRLHILANYGNWSRLDHRYLLSIGAVLFNRPDFKQAAGEFHEETLWLLGDKADSQEITANSLTDYRNDKQLRSKAFPEGGFYIMRQDGFYMIVDCAPASSKAPSGHKHNSRLSFELFAYDKSFVIDPGAYIYTADKDMRNLFRGTKYHNTVVVDGEEQNRFDEDELFSMGNDAAVKVNRWEVTDEYDILDAEHSGYERLKNPVIHRRQIFFNKKEGYWIIRDILTGKGKHNFDLYFHLAPLEIEVDKTFPLVVKTRTEGANLAIIPLESEGVSIDISEGWISYQYGVKLKAPIVRYSRKSHTSTSFYSIIYPYIKRIDISEVITEANEARLETPLMQEDYG